MNILTVFQIPHLITKSHLIITDYIFTNYLKLLGKYAADDSVKDFIAFIYTLLKNDLSKSQIEEKKLHKHDYIKMEESHLYPIIRANPDYIEVTKLKLI